MDASSLDDELVTVIGVVLSHPNPLHFRRRPRRSFGVPGRPPFGRSAQHQEDARGEPTARLGHGKLDREVPAISCLFELDFVSRAWAGRSDVPFQRPRNDTSFCLKQRRT